TLHASSPPKRHDQHIAPEPTTDDSYASQPTTPFASHPCTQRTEFSINASRLFSERLIIKRQIHPYLRSGMSLPD
ncbi:MAG: hypothetical protein ACYCTG_07970, partial [Ferrimicrobium sp.]